MSQFGHQSNAPYDGSALIADPIHQYVSFTVPFSTADPHERTEKDLIDSSWVQRLRYIYQLQSARWVYPSAEHTRFVHSLGTMHVAGRFARHLYPFLKKALREVPSANYVEEFLRVTALDRIENPLVINLATLGSAGHTEDAEPLLAQKPHDGIEQRKDERVGRALRQC